eukprot:TRINITY_DN4495_c0_g2_i1.p1 TRINITY_DN4495_c0_g2~~TRINITY_DN4495_c0_g2_i1.p1  ORF type:complete len:267 (-),score=66.86 TRINITY_DN4495_c0_g2_i1:90-890(-)
MDDRVIEMRAIKPKASYEEIDQPTSSSDEFETPLKGTTQSNSNTQQPMPLQEIREDVYSVEVIISRKRVKGRWKYLLKWLGYDEETWEDERNLIGCEDLIKDYERRERMSWEDHEKQLEIDRRSRLFSHYGRSFQGSLPPLSIQRNPPKNRESKKASAAADAEFLFTMKSPKKVHKTSTPNTQSSQKVQSSQPEKVDLSKKYDSPQPPQTRRSSLRAEDASLPTLEYRNTEIQIKPQSNVRILHVDRKEDVLWGLVCWYVVIAMHE